MSNLFLTIADSSPSNKSLVVNEEYQKELLYLSTFYSRFISEIDIPDLERITIELVDNEQDSRVLPSNQFTRVCVIHHYFDWRSIKPEIEQKDRLLTFLDLIMSALDQAAQLYSWPTEGFVNAYFKVIELNFINEFIVTNYTYSEDKELNAVVWVVRSIEFSKLVLRISNVVNDSIRNEIVLKTIAHFYDDFSQLARSITWKSNNQIIVSGKGGEIHFCVNPEDEIVNVSLTPKSNSEAYLKQELVLSDALTSDSEYSSLIKNSLEDFDEFKEPG